MYFQYGDKETEYLKSKDKKLAEVIDKVGHVDRTVDTDLFSSVVHHIIGQQISTKAQQTIWLRLNEKYGHVTPEVIDSADAAELQSLGMTFRKAEYIKDFSHKVVSGEFIEKSTKSFLKNTAGGCPLTAALQACISGRYRAALLRE